MSSMNKWIASLAITSILAASLSVAQAAPNMTLTSIRRNYHGARILKVFHYKNGYIVIEYQYPKGPTLFDLYNLETGTRVGLPTDANDISLAQIVNQNDFVFDGNGINSEVLQNVFPYTWICSRKNESSKFGWTQYPKYLKLSQGFTFNDGKQEELTNYGFAQDGIEFQFGPFKNEPSGEFYAGATWIPPTQISYSRQKNQLTIKLPKTLISPNFRVINDPVNYISSVRMQSSGNGDTSIVLQLKPGTQFYNAKVTTKGNQQPVPELLLSFLPKNVTFKPGMVIFHDANGKQVNQHLTPLATFPPQNTRTSVATSKRTVKSKKTASHFDPAPLDAVSFISRRVGFVAGNDGIYKTIDGGATWRRVYTSKAPILGLEAAYQPVGKREYVVAYTKTYLIRSIDGKHFSIQGVGGNTDGGSGTNIEGVSLLNNNQIYLLNNGVVWATNGLDGGLYRAALQNTVESITGTWDSIGRGVCYAVAGTSVYKSTDMEHWARVFTEEFTNGQSSWRGMIQSNGKYVWLTIYGGRVNKQTGEEAYVILASNNDGKTWKPVAENPDFSSFYKGIHLEANQNIGQKPLSMNVLASGKAVFVSHDTVVGKTLISTFRFDKSKLLRGSLTATNQANAFDNTSSVGVFFIDDTHGWIIGSKQGKGYVYSTNDGGVTWKMN